MAEPARILLLEDNPYDAELAQRALIKDRIEAEFQLASTGSEFETMLGSFQPDLVLSDFSLPDYDGFAALQAVRALDPNIPFILLTGAIGEEAAVKMLQLGAFDYILKDRLARLSGAVQQALENAHQRRELRAAEDRYGLLMNSSLYGVWDWNLISGDMYLSPQWKNQLGYADDELENSLETFKRLLYEDDRGKVFASIQAFSESPDVWDIEFRMLHKDGNIRWINARASHVTDRSGVVVRMLGVHIDVTQRHKDEQRLRQAATVFSSTIEGVTITDAEGNIIDVNPAFTDITGYSRDEVIGKNPRVLKSGRHDEGFYRSMWDAITRDGHWSGEIWNRRANGSVYPELLSVSAVRNDKDELSGYVGVFADITQSKRTEERLEFLAHHDPLTLLPNRLLFFARLNQAVQRAHRQGTHLAVIFVDLDRFKNINDSLGHPAGDSLLRMVAERMLGVIRKDDTLARISGDEFVLCLENVPTIDSTTSILHKLMGAFRQPFQLDEQEVTVTCSIGISVYPEDGGEADELLRNADAAMYRAKQEGRNNYEFYSPEMTVSAFEHVFLQNALHSALAQDELIQFYQPQCLLEDGRLVGCETLIRWQHPQQGMILPQRFIPIAEQTGLIREIDNWMLRRACEQGRHWCDQGYAMQRVSVNMTGSQIQHPGFAESVLRVLDETRFPKDHLEIEVTESFVMQRPEAGILQLKKLYDQGVSIAIDDFGTGYSSLSYLKNLPVNKIKLDQSFVKDVISNPDTRAIVQAIIDLSRALGKVTMVEGVETREQVTMLRAMGCDQAQGYYMSVPLSEPDMSALLAAGSCCRTNNDDG